MERDFKTWNLGSGEPWVTVRTDEGTCDLTVEEARELAIDIIYRAWTSERVGVLVKEIRAEDQRIKMKSAGLHNGA